MLKNFSVFLAVLFLFPIVAFGADNGAESAIVMDLQSQTILYEKNIYEQRSVASTTKIMTALIATESNKLNEVVTVSEDMVNVEGTSLGLKEGDKITLYDLIVGMMLTSGNDAATAVAIFLCGSVENFSVVMNKRAEEIGMKNTYFVTPSGLDEGDHHSTAYDMALLACRAIENEDFCNICSLKNAQISINNQSVTVYNHNKLLSADENFIGIKTGYTDKAGRCLVSAKEFNGNIIICVTLSDNDDWNDHIKLTKECEDKYTKYSLCNSISVCVVGAKENEINCSYDYECYMVGEVTTEEYYYPFVYAPVKAGDTVGYVYIYCNNNLVERLPIEADEGLKYAKQE